MNLTKQFTDRIEQHLTGLDQKCISPRVLPLLLEDVERAAEEAGNAIIDGLTQKRVLRVFAESYKMGPAQVTLTKTDAVSVKSAAGSGAQPLGYQR